MLFPIDGSNDAFAAYGRGAKGDTGEVSDAELAAEVAALKGGASAGYDTLGEIETKLGLKANLAGPQTHTGDHHFVTQANGNNSTKAATNEFVQQELTNTLLDYLPLAGGTMTGPFTLADDPVSPLQAVTKQYVDNLLAGLNPKHSVRAATTANITLSGAQVIDGVSLVPDVDSALVKNQSTPSQNGLYDVKSGAWTRRADADVWAELPAAFVFVEEGTTNADTGWTCTSNAGGTLGSTAVTWVQFSSAGVPVAGNGLTKTGNTFSIDTAITVDKTTAQTLTNKTLTAQAISSPTGIVKGDVGLGNVDNTSDATKNAAAVTLTNKTLTSPVINTPTGIVKGDVGLGSVDNTSDATKNAASVALTNKDLTSATNTFPTMAAAARNPVVNPAMDVSQELGTTGATLVNNTAKYILDCWEAMYNHGAATAIVTSAQLASGSFPSPIAGFQFGHQIKATTAITSPASGDFAKHRTKIEGYRVAHWGWGASGASAIVVAFALYSTGSGVAFVKLSNSDQSRCYYHEITVAAGVNFFAFNVPGETSGTWQATTATGLTAEVFVSGKETTPASSLDAWGATNKVQTTNSTNLLGTNNNLTILTGVYIDVGTLLPVAADLPRLMRPKAEEEHQRCKRYWRWLTNGVGQAKSSTSAYIGVSHDSPPMRTTPNYALVTGTGALTELGVSGRTLSAIADDAKSPTGGTLSLTSSSLTTGNQVALVPSVNGISAEARL